MVDQIPTFLTPRHRRPRQNDALLLAAEVLSVPIASPPQKGCAGPDGDFLVLNSAWTAIWRFQPGD
ncbi:hypothetical protein ACWC9Q_38180 [Streptomyces sp. NPDC001142]